MTELPLSASDLISVGQALEPIETQEAITNNPIIGRIEVLRPDGDDVIGYFRREGTPGTGDAWFGFVADVNLTDPH